MGSDDGEKKVLAAAPPPWHSVVLLGIFVVVFLGTLPSLEKLDEAATMETFTKVLFPEYLSLRAVAYIRGCLALTAWTVTLEMVFLSKGWFQSTAYQKDSKLKMVPLHMSGIKTCFPFTSVSWNLLALSFTLSSYIAFQGVQEARVAPWVLRLALGVWEVAAPNSVLVAAVVRYAIWPGVLAKGNSTENLKSLRNVFLHNLNVFFTTTECAMLGGLPVRWSELSLAPLVGCAYVIFSWNMTTHWNKREHGPQFIYHFFDTTLPGYTHSIVLMALLMALIVFYALFSSCGAMLRLLDAGLLGSLGFVVAICAAVMRFRDY